MTDGPSARLQQSASQWQQPEYLTVAITAKGYSRVYDPASKRLRMEHDLVWERVHGFIPAGFDVHHINHDKLDNRIENLELLDRLTHKRHHSGCVQREGIWWKPCRKCATMKAVTEYYARMRGWLSPWCKSCQIQNALRNKRKRREVTQKWLLLAGRLGKEARLDSDGRVFREIAGEFHSTAASDRPLPPRDSGSDSRTARRQSRRARTVPRSGGLVG